MQGKDIIEQTYGKCHLLALIFNMQEEDIPYNIIEHTHAHIFGRASFHVGRSPTIF
jgi:hypothetical protein